MRNLGIDLGRTIKGPTKDDYNKPFPDAFEVISQLTKKFNNIYVVSRVNSDQRERAIKWLEDEKFYDLTGIKRENIYYCFDRRDKGIFQKGLDIDYFIDDRPSCLYGMETHVIKFLFNPWPDDLIKYEAEIKEIKNLIIVNNWKEIGEFFGVKI